LIPLSRVGSTLAVLGLAAGLAALSPWGGGGADLARAADDRLWLEDAFPGLRFARPLYATQAPDGSELMYVVEQRGRIHAVQHPAPASPAVAARATFLDLSRRVSPRGNERGLLGLAFHPDYAKNGRFFVHYSRRRDGATVLSEFGLLKGKSKTGDPGSERILLTRAQPAANHNGGMLTFGPDGMLYLGLGDGGAAGDPWETGQDLSSWLGSILRIDVDRRGVKGGDEDREYAIPDDNPFLKVAGALPEIWAYGLRNPWRFSFDRATGDLWCGDVGQVRWEEVDIVTRGANMGWDRREGFEGFEPEDDPPRVPFTDPIIVHRHIQNGGDAASITGGYVYRGSAIPWLVGTYVYGDFAGGWINGITRDAAASSSEAKTGGAKTTRFLSPRESIASFAEDRAGELYICSFSEGGRVLRIRGRNEEPTDKEPDE